MRTHPRTLAALFALLPAALSSCKKAGTDATDGGPAASGASAAAAGASLSFLSGFEGEIDGFTKDSSKPNAQPVALTVLIKSGKVKLEIPDALIKGAANNPLGEKGYVVFDSAAKTLTAVSDPKKMAIVIDLNSSGKTLSGFSPPAAGGHAPGTNKPAPKITKTGKHDTVAGYPCEYWDITSDHKEGTVCVGNDGPSWFSIPMTGIPTESAWMMDLLDGKHFPLRFVGYGKDGTTEEGRVEVTKIDKKAVADTEFQIPAGYKTIDLDKMFQGGPAGFGGGLGMPHGEATGRGR